MPKVVPFRAPSYRPSEQCSCWSCRHARRRAHTTPLQRFFATWAVFVVILIALAAGASHP